MPGKGGVLATLIEVWIRNAWDGDVKSIQDFFDN